jgi:hypothetical protein
MSIAEQESNEIVRPLRILVPLIKEDLQNGDEAALQAGMPYYEAAGKKMLEAKPQMSHGEFGPWLKRNFNKSRDQCERYMQLAIATADRQNPRTRNLSSLRELDRHTGRDPRPTGGAVRREYTVPVDIVLERAANIRNLHEESLKREVERKAERRLATELIEIGYKVLATKLHPDRGGSHEAMKRLNHVKNHLLKFA